MKLLIIEDSQKNIASAKETLKGHNVTIIDNIQDAYKILSGPEKFDAVLTDLFLPIGSFWGSMASGKEVPAELPAGLVFAIKASNNGMRVVILTDSDHHQNWICSLLDLLYSYPEPEATKRVAYVEARNACMQARWDEAKQELIPDAKVGGFSGHPLVKNWLEAMKTSELFPEVK